MKNGRCLLLLLGLLALTVAATVPTMSTSGIPPSVTFETDSSGTDGYQEFNNSLDDESEDSWVANAFTVVAGGEDIKSISFVTGDSYK